MRWVAVASLVVASACFAPDLGQQPFRCGAQEPRCPPGYTCGADLTCKHGTGGAKADAAPTVDGARTPDAMTLCSDDNGCNVAGGELCFPVVGCAKICEGSAGRGRLEGCEFLPTPAANAQSPTSFAITVLNGADAEARVRIDGGGLGAPRFLVIPARSSATEKLPWINDLSVCQQPSCTMLVGGSGLYSKASYRVLATGPVSVVEWSPFGPTATGDAARLLPTRALGKEYVTMSATPASGALTYLAVTAPFSSTSVTVKPHATTTGTAGFPVINRGTPRTFTMERGDVLLLYSLSDLTGSEISSDRQVQVLSGSACAGSFTTSPCSHTEEAIPPRAALSNDVLAPILPNTTVTTRIVAADGATAVDVTDGVNVQHLLLIEKGAFKDVTQGSADGQIGQALITANDSGAILVAQTLTGAPAMTILRPPAETETLVEAPRWQTHIVTVVARAGDRVRVDGATPQGGGVPIGQTAYQRFLFDVPPGPHVVETDSDSVVGLIATDASNGAATLWY